jgi:hypothetical protein
MNTFARILRATNWKYAVGEVALIFVGITLALAANSWYENLKNREEEREILRQVVVGLETDVEALKTAQSSIEAKVGLMTQLEAHIRDELPYSGDLDVSFKSILTGASARMNTAAFDTLKFRGMDLVSSPELRNQLVDYYGTEQTLLDQRNRNDRGDMLAAEPYFKKNFRWESGALLMTPIDYSSLVNDQEFLNILAVRIWALNNLALRVHARIIGKAEQLILAIQYHLESMH